MNAVKKVIDFFKRRRDIKRINEEKLEKVRRTKTQHIVFAILFVVLILYSISLIYPFIWIFMNSFKTTQDFFSNFNGLPQSLRFANYIEAFSEKKVKNYTVFNMLQVTLILTVAGTAVTVMVSSAAAYVMAKYEFKGKEIIFSVVIFSMIVPIVGTLPAQLNLMKNLRLYDNMLGMIFLYSGGFGFNFLMLYSFFKNLPWGYAEAARIDGARDFKIFYSIMMPLAKGPIFAISIITAIGLWNDYGGPAIFLPSMPSLAVGMETLIKTLQNGNQYPILFATVFIVLAPIIIVFILFSNTIMRNTSIGGLKG